MFAKAVHSGVSPEYFKKEMTWNELRSLLEVISEENIQRCESTRLIMWSVLQAQSKKRIKPQDILKFAWEGNKGVEVDKVKLIDKDSATEIINRIKNGKKAI